MTQTNEQVEKIIAEKARRDLAEVLWLLRNRTGYNAKLAIQYVQAARGWLKRVTEE